VGDGNVRDGDALGHGRGERRHGPRIRWGYRLQKCRRRLRLGQEDGGGRVQRRRRCPPGAQQVAKSLSGCHGAACYTIACYTTTTIVTSIITIIIIITVIIIIFFHIPLLLDEAIWLLKRRLAYICGGAI
jgi:hypothetical protein